jgi:uncharacterized membrane protein
MATDTLSHRAREKRVLLLLGMVLAAASILIAALGHRLPAPFRIEAALSNLVAAIAVLLFRYQNYK